MHRHQGAVAVTCHRPLETMGFQKSPGPCRRIFSVSFQAHNSTNGTFLISWCDLNHLSVRVGATCGALTLSFVIDGLNQGSSFLALKLQEVSSELGMSLFDLCISEGQINIMLYSLKM